MLQVTVIRDEKERILRGLKKRRLKNVEESIENILALDQDRKQTQKRQDELQAEGNVLAKEIGSLMKSGQKEKAEDLKARTGEIKKQVADLTPVLSKIE